MDKSKFQSRKFICWLTASIFVLMSFITYIIVKDAAIMEVTKIFAESWGWVSSVYIGMNCVQKFVKDKDGIKNDSQDIIMR